MGGGVAGVNTFLIKLGECWRMEVQRRTTRPDPWINQIFETASARKGGIVYRSKASVERECGVSLLELEVRRRGFHLVETDACYAVFCTPGAIRIIC